MKRVLLGSALALVLAAPAFASPLVGSDSHDTNYSQGQTQGQTASASAASGSSSHSLSGASNRTSVRNTTQSLNQQELDNRNVAAQGQGQSADNAQANSMSDDDTNKTEVYAISYTDAAPNTVAASIGDGVVVTTWGVKVLGPIFGMTDQHVHYLPKAVEDSAKVAYLATTNDGSYDGERVQFVYIAAVCAHDAALAEQLNLGCK